MLPVLLYQRGADGVFMISLGAVHRTIELFGASIGVNGRKGMIIPVTTLYFSEVDNASGAL